MDRLVEGAPIDMLVVDGAVAVPGTTDRIRYPALPFFRSKFADDAVIVLDDIHRRGERQIVRQWQRLLGVPFAVRRVKGCVAIAHTGPGRAVFL